MFWEIYASAVEYVGNSLEKRRIAIMEMTVKSNKEQIRD
jgi:hypothetical protein